jgi:hypothetical protein
MDFTIIEKYNNDWRYGPQDMSPMWIRPTWYKTISRHTLKTRTTGLEHYSHNYIKINSLDYEQQFKLKERHLEQ